MSDRELLELAANAADIRHEGFLSTGALWAMVGKKGTYNQWNPLTDDGDALRLAVKLGLAIRALEKCVYVESDPETLLGQSSVSELEMYKGDPYAATRLAIVRAAAEIGKGME